MIQIYITKIAVKCILVVVIKCHHRADVLASLIYSHQKFDIIILGITIEDIPRC